MNSIFGDIQKRVALKCIFCLIIVHINTNAQPHIKKDWKANWITLPETMEKANSWTIYRKSFDLNGKLNQSAIVNIATDSKYWLYINDRMVVFEGGLKRGPTPKDTYYDSLDISKYLKNGSNTVAVLVWFWNRDGYSHKDSGKTGLLFELELKNDTIISDSSWKVAEHTAFGQTGEPFPNYRLPEYNIHYDARKEVKNWYSSRFDDSKFDNAKLLGKAGMSPWNDLWKRPIPLWRDSGLVTYENNKSWPNKSEDQEIVMQLPKNITITPYLEIEAPAGKLIDIRTDNYKGGSEYNVRTEYVTKNGVQRFETPGYLNGHKVIYNFPEGVKIIDLKYRETRYDADYNGYFTSSNEDLNTLWQKSRNTMNINLRDAIQDPDRERAQWWGDAVIVLGEMFYSADTLGHKLIRKAISNLVEWQKNSGVLHSPVPEGETDSELPSQMLASVGKYGFYRYFEYTNDTTFVKYFYPNVKKYMNLWKLDNNNLVVHRKGEWSWYDWGDKIDVPLLDNAWYYLALDGAARLADVAGFKEDALLYRRTMVSLKEAFNENFWTGQFYKSPSFEFKVDDRGNGLAVVAGLATTEQWEKLRPVLDTTFNSGPYLEKYILESYFVMGDGAAGVNRMLKRYDEMINSPLTTLWEGWEINSSTYGGGSYNHGWAGGPLTLMSQYISGFEPGKAGFQEIKLFPQPSGLKNAQMGFETVKGFLETSFLHSDENFELKAEVPEGTGLIVGIPKFSRPYKSILMNGKEIWRGGRSLNSKKVEFMYEDNRYIVFKIDEQKPKFKGLF